MFERIVDIIAYVIAELRQNKRIYEIDIDVLTGKGYTESEISAAFSWLVDRLEFTSDNKFAEGENFAPESYRILHEAEEQLFTPEAWGVLVELRTLGIINNLHIENIIERAMVADVSQISAEQLKSFIATMLFNVKTNHSSPNRIMLKGNDTVN